MRVQVTNKRGSRVRPCPRRTGIAAWYGFPKRRSTHPLSIWIGFADSFLEVGCRGESALVRLGLVPVLLKKTDATGR